MSDKIQTLITTYNKQIDQIANSDASQEKLEQALQTLEQGLTAEVGSEKASEILDTLYENS